MGVLGIVKKKFFMGFGCTVLVGLLSVFFTGCGLNKQLTAPVLLQVSGDYVASWTDVENAKDYTVNIDGAEYQSNGNSFQIPMGDITQEVGTFKIKVKANAASKSYKSSAYSNEFLFYKVGKLDTPAELQFDSLGEHLLWVAVPNAVSYIVSVDEVEFEAETNSFELAKIEFAGQLIMKVKAVGDAKPYANSNFSQSIARKITRTLATPKNESIEVVNGQIVWEAIPDAVGYIVEIDLEPVVTAENSISIETEQLEEPKLYQIKIKASGDGEYYLDSLFSFVFSYTQPQRLETPKTVSVNFNAKLVSWTAVEGAKSYQVLIERPDYSSSQSTTDIEFSLNFMQTTGEFTVKVKAISGTDEKRDSVYTHGFDLVLGYELATPSRGSYNPSTSQITWSSVSHADAYILLVGGKEYRSETTSFDLREAGAPDTYTVYIRAVSDEIIYFDSSYSAGIQCKLVVTLATPVNIKIDEEQSAVVWDISPYVKHYTVYVYFGAIEDNDVQRFSTFNEEFSLSNLKRTGDYVILVQACGNGDGTTKDSQMSNEQSFYLIALLEKPYSTSLNYISKLYSFKEVENAVGYVVNLDGTDYHVGDILYFDLSGVESGEHIIKYKALADGVNYKDSEYSSGLKFSFQ